MARGKAERTFIEAGKPHRFRKGQTGNAGGRPKSKLLSDAYKSMLAQPVPGDPEGRTWADLAAERMIHAIVKGNVHAAREIAERTEGKACQQVEPIGENSGVPRMSREELLRRVREFYGLSDPSSNTEKPSLN